MTIYILSEDHTQTAKWLDDKSLDRQIKDIAQVLCNVHYQSNDVRSTEGLLNLRRIPMQLRQCNRLYIFEWSQWARQCRANYLWLVDLLNECLKEYIYNRIIPHNMYQVLCWARDNVPDLPVKPMDIKSENVIRDIYGNYTMPLPIIMPKKYKVYGQGDEYDVGGSILVYTYRNYYQATLIKKYKKIKEDAMRIVEDYVAVKQFNYLWTLRHQPEWINLEEV